MIRHNTGQSGVLLGWGGLCHLYQLVSIAADKLIITDGKCQRSYHPEMHVKAPKIIDSRFLRDHVNLKLGYSGLNSRIVGVIALTPPSVLSGSSEPLAGDWQEIIVDLPAADVA